MTEKGKSTLPEDFDGSRRGDADSFAEKEKSSQSPGSSSGQDDDETRKKHSPPTWKSYVILAILFIAYICLNLIGAVIFKAIERDSLAGKPHPFAKRKLNFVEVNGTNLTVEALNEFLEEVMNVVDVIESITANDTVYGDPWTLNQGFLLSFTIASTIGYGVLTPKTEGGQLFAVFYALLSIPFTGLLAAKLGSILAYFIKKAAAFIFGNRKSNRWVKTASILFTFLVGLLIYVIIPSLVLAYVDNDEGWSFIESFYCIFITLTTIGFGDYVPDPHASAGMAGNILVLIWVVAGLAWVATIVNLIATTITKKATSIKKKVASQHLTVKSIKHRLNKSASKKPGKTSNSLEAQHDKENGQEGEETLESASAGQPKSERGSKDSSPAKPPELRSDAKRDSVLGPSGIIAVVVNNMENYQRSDEAKEED